jgi:glycosyltransferase involved in cell wall biosynthesis
VFARIPDARLLLVGKGLFGEEKKFLEMSQARGWHARVVDAGWVEMSRLRAFFSAADVAIYPFDDTLINRTKCPVKLIDLLAAGVPVVAEAVGQLREYIQNNETGMLVSPGEEEEFARSVIELLDDADKRARLGACAAAKMARDYGWEKLAERVEGVYR